MATLKSIRKHYGPALNRTETALHHAFSASREHAKISGAALDEFGDGGPRISGIVRDHFPQHVKDALRRLCDTMNAYAKEAEKAKPKGMRASTYRTFYHAIRAEVGCGFYL